jgi:menaquinone-dependent protoporphyrinogen IX oxidase
MEEIMAKTLVMYFSKYGTTKKYAEWIASELNGDVYDIKNIKHNILGNYDTIILGTALYAGQLKGLEIIINNYENIKNKKIVIFTCGLADYSKSENINAIRKRIAFILSEKIMENIKIYYLRGDIDYKKLNLMHKIMMWMLKKMIMKKEEINEEGKDFLETYGRKTNFMNKDNINEIINYCK